MKNLIPLFLAILLSGCAGTAGPITIDGKINQQKTTLIGLTTDLFLVVDFLVVCLVYVLSGAILTNKNTILSTSNPTSYLDTLINQKNKQLNLQPASVDAFRNLMVLAKGKVRAEIELPGITDYDLATVLIGIVEAVHKSA